MRFVASLVRELFGLQVFSIIYIIFIICSNYIGKFVLMILQRRNIVDICKVIHETLQLNVIANINVSLGSNFSNGQVSDADSPRHHGGEVGSTPEPPYITAHDTKGLEYP